MDWKNFFLLQLGKVEGLLTLLRGVPHNAAKLRKVYLPISLLAEHKVSTESIIRHSFEAGNMKNLTEHIAASADEHLTNCRFRSNFLNREEKQILFHSTFIFIIRTSDRWRLNPLNAPSVRRRWLLLLLLNSLGAPSARPQLRNRRNDQFPLTL